MSLETQAFIRIVYGILLFIQFLIILPFTRTYFTTERFHGCIHSTPWRDRLLNPTSYFLLMALWMGSAAGLALGILPVLFSFINLILCYTFFVRMRWASPLRGMGAPGYISYWLSGLVFFLEYSTHFGDPAGHLRDVVVLAFRIDFAVMMIDSGINKIMHGYPKDMGMNYGMANPAWGYWPGIFKNIPPTSWLFRFFNHSAYIFQILGGILMLIPPTQWLGAFIIFGSFLLVKVVIRLGVLCDMLMLITFLYTKPNGWFEQVLFKLMPNISFTSMNEHPAPAIVNGILIVGFWAYIFILPFLKFGMYTNLYLKKSLPKFFQKSLEIFTNTFGVILWRVFTIDLIDYFIRIYFEDPVTKKRTLYTRFGHWSPKQTNRFLWVGESIMTLIVFNTQRYFPKTDLFRKRLICYAGSMPCPKNERVVFEYVILDPTPSNFDYVPIKEYTVDISAGTLQEKAIRDLLPISLRNRTSPIQGTTRPGSYAPG